MKKLLILLSFVLISITSIAQDVVVIKHTNYTAHYSKSKMYPVMVEWWLTKSMISCPTPLKRKDNFKPDPKLVKETDIAQDYVGSGTDRGHMMPAAENLCQTPAVQDECFYFSNMAAQYHSLNAGDWKSVETLERQIASEQDSTRIWCGNVGEIKRIGRVAVPKQCWKVIYVKKTKEWKAFLFENNTSKPDGYLNNQVDVSVIEKLTGFKFR
jgi:endonuclease G, mitochondrial